MSVPRLRWIELKSFFSEGISTVNGDIVSNTVIKKHIKELIGNEDKAKPLTDELITKLLIDKNFIIARRTVTKYRVAMKIPAARLRKNNI